MARKNLKRKTPRPERQKQQVVAKVILPEPVTKVVTEKIITTIEPELDIKKPATLAQALTEPAVAVVKLKRKVRRIVERSTRRAA